MTINITCFNKLISLNNIKKVYKQEKNDLNEKFTNIAAILTTTKIILTFGNEISKYPSSFLRIALNFDLALEILS